MPTRPSAPTTIEIVTVRLRLWARIAVVASPLAFEI
jgi:hypothetical protein